VCEVIGAAKTQALEALPSVPAAHFHLKGQTQKTCSAHPQKVKTLTCYIKMSVGYCELKLYRDLQL